MENASKALIIAGAILISILIISFGVIILGQGSDIIKNNDMSEAEVTAYNSKFENYEGTRVTAANVRQLIKLVDLNNDNNPDKQITLNQPDSISSQHTYTVVTSTSNSGLIDTITITENS